MLLKGRLTELVQSVCLHSLVLNMGFSFCFGPFSFFLLICFHHPPPLTFNPFAGSTWCIAQTALLKNLLQSRSKSTHNLFYSRPTSFLDVLFRSLCAWSRLLGVLRILLSLTWPPSWWRSWWRKRWKPSQSAAAWTSPSCGANTACPSAQKKILLCRLSRLSVTCVT